MNMLKIGDKAPDFELLDQHGNTLNSKDYKGQSYVVFFYPKASTPGCTAEACNLRDAQQDLLDKGIKVIGVSADSVKRQSNFSVKQELNYPLLADEDRVLINAYGVWGPKKFMGKEYDGIHRTTFLVNNQGVIREVISKVKTKDHANQILALIE
ncbi:thioredoxin-dependent thiol peroxidase [Flavobacteriaceae bacterium]|nr:thioredoxin-dependent thiol peroxidase [Flavobacteriaceae bacterium]